VFGVFSCKTDLRRRYEMNRTTARTVVVAGLMAGLGVGLFGAPAGLAQPIFEPPIGLDPNLGPITIPPPVFEPPVVVPTLPSGPFTRTRLPLPPVTTTPGTPTSTTMPSTTTPSTTTTVPSTTTDRHPSPTPLPTPTAQPRPYPKGAPETGGGADGPSTTDYAVALGALAIGLGGLGGATALVRRRQTSGR
jgi:hypothetical protein